MNITGIVLKKKTAKKGIRVDHGKITASSPVEKIPLPEKVIISMQQNIGAPCSPLVKKGDRVLAGQKIGDSQAFVKSPVHATVSGEVAGITRLINPPTGASVEAVIIESDGQDSRVEQYPVDNLDSLTRGEILEKIGEAGIVGLGGAAFPTKVKLSPSPEIKIDTVILNGCECEPYVTADHRVMLEYGEKVLSGLDIIRKVISPENCCIAIEDNKQDAINHLEKLIDSMGYRDRFRIVPMESRYPTGGEKILTKVILGREVPIGGLPTAIGAIVQNVSTAKAIHEAVLEDRHYVEKVITVTGMVRNPKNLLVRIGTPVSNLVEYCGGMEDGANQVIIGGPMMGVSQYDLDFPVTKGTNCILVAKGRQIQERNCIRCGACIEVCPMCLVPTNYVKYARKGMYDECKKEYIEDCFECGCCSYACPAGIPLTQYIKTAKSEINRRKTRS